MMRPKAGKRRRPGPGSNSSTRRSSKKGETGSSSAESASLEDTEPGFVDAQSKLCPSAFQFNKKRVRILTKCKDIAEDCDGIVYWMARDQRVQDNWSFLYAQKLALRAEAPLHVCFCLVPQFLGATIRQFRFMLDGLKEVERECLSRDISFHLLIGRAPDVLPKFIRDNSIGGVVTDFSPLRVFNQWLDRLIDELPDGVSLCQVDAHNIVPCWLASSKLEYSARTIRRKIHDKLDEFLTHFPPVIKHPYRPRTRARNDWEGAERSLEVDMNVREVDWATPGTEAGLAMLRGFCNERLKSYASKRGDPTHSASSNLSPWFHFGQVSVQRCILVVEKYRRKHKASVEAFVEEAVVRRELSDNYCYYCKDYDKLAGAWDWAQKTLRDHAKDKRSRVYSRKTLEKAETHDPLWNACQIQMIEEGKMHGFLRMYWAKKILEWTESPEKALRVAIYLNDKYLLDGRDPNGYVGCMWSICGVHDQGWKEREVFGKIRYMNYAGCRRKFDVDAFVRKYTKR